MKYTLRSWNKNLLQYLNVFHLTNFICQETSFYLLKIQKTNKMDQLIYTFKKKLYINWKQYSFRTSELVQSNLIFIIPVRIICIQIKCHQNCYHLLFFFFLFKNLIILHSIIINKKLKMLYFFLQELYINIGFSMYFLV